MKIAIIDDYQRLAQQLADWTVLPADTELQFFPEPAADADALVQRLASFDVVVTMRERTAFPAAVLERLPALRMLACTGLRNAVIDMAACERLGIAVCGSRGSRLGLVATAETAWALILALYKRLPESDDATREGRWQPRLAQTLAGRTLGLVGLGNIGQHMARVGLAFGMDVIAWSANLDDERSKRAGVRRVDKLDLFAQSDVVSLHLVLSDRTRGVVGAPELSAMRPGAYLINTSRAGLVDEASFMESLQQHRIGGAGLDVFWQEPLPKDHPICALDNVVLTPHLGYATEDNMHALYTGVIENLLAWNAGRPPRPLLG